MRTYTITELSTLFGVNRSTVYRWLKQYKRQLATAVRKTDKGRVITEEGRAILADFVASCNSYETATQQPETACDSNATPLADVVDEYKGLMARQDVRITQQENTIRQLQGDIRNLIEGQQEERRRSDSIIFRLSEQVNSQALALEDMRQQQPSPGIFNRFWKWLNGTVVEVQLNQQERKKSPGLRPVTSKAA